MVTVNSKVSRSWLLVNPSREASLDAAIASTNADEVVLDLEDAVAPNEKESARGRVLEYLNSGGSAWVRVNDASSDFWSADCRALADARGLKGVVLAKTEGGNHMWDTSNRLGGETPVIALIETARGLSRVHDIAAARPCFRIAFGVNDYTLDIGVDQDPLALAYSRSQLVVASRAAHIPGPIDGPTRDPAELPEAVSLTRRMGMTGKLALRSSDADTINTGLSPSDEDVSWAQDFVDRFNSQGGKPKDGSDLPRLNRARIILERARMLGLITP
ncbi:HpcH/HpaI aldolase/citrate lyase family protein [Mycobacteroides abscessus]|uniref:HpcH/HpaI aldolase/citrate lyase family protein n=1 Tax=Mycobacteroides abscessus TaxID=36809 RepID=UPI0009CB53ED|nr:CoA ester lyase [Mycobacteroides abscessus]SKJ00149.1 citryl-CoA lyase [Mycobacteroides abscessus subsp. massiliense]SKJ95837.1 citryl-CoA lyase [Mycobacteroides abscessus subsp. massiliense]SKK44086.1 citryl-CoA lyase [Mycobacteroides abscessus subsp. massiliense]SKR77271.1 citryl-CoA lyase [Mycobacteroides abscessus subsp. massiliense]SKS67636.1 citryl-CoA lyase [Mycobacteroides abscessus subsp. massiliense]